MRDIENTSTDLGDTFKLEPFHFYVGQNQKYKTIASAIWDWINVYNRQTSIIHLSMGEYNEVVSLGANRNISFIGEDKSKVIWRTKTGYYKDCPLAVQGGNVLIKGITFIADRTDNPNFMETSLSSGDPASDNIGCAYGLHIDFSGTGKTEIVDCDIISYQNAGLGCGTKTNQEILVRNCNIYSYTPSSFSSLSNGGLLYHTSNVSATGQKLRLHNVNVFSESGKAFEHQNVTPSLTGSETELINCNFRSNALSGDSLVNFLNGVNLTNNCYGNNVGKCNQGNSIKLTKDDGYCIPITDCNNSITTQFWTCNGQKGGLNTPVPYIVMGQTIAYNNLFVIQYAWHITSKFEKYKRYCLNGTWSSWELCLDTFKEERDALFKGNIKMFRPTGLNSTTDRGYYYFDTQLDKPIWWNGTSWIDATGTSV